MPLGMEEGLGLRQIVLDVDPAPPPQKGAQPLPQLLAHVYCAQTAGWIKMPLAMEVGVGLDPSNIVLDGDPAPPLQKRGRAPNFRPLPVVAKRPNTS